MSEPVSEQVSVPVSEQVSVPVSEQVSMPVSEPVSVSVSEPVSYAVGIAHLLCLPYGFIDFHSRHGFGLLTIVKCCIRRHICIVCAESSVLFFGQPYSPEQRHVYYVNVCLFVQVSVIENPAPVVDISSKLLETVSLSSYLEDEEDDEDEDREGREVGEDQWSLASQLSLSDRYIYIYEYSTHTHTSAQTQK